jgi:hypothetical protein
MCAKRVVKRVGRLRMLRGDAVRARLLTSSHVDSLRCVKVVMIEIYTLSVYCSLMGIESWDGSDEV